MSNCRTDTPDLPPLPSHPDSHTMAWTDREKAAIADYAREAVRLAARASVPAGRRIQSTDELVRVAHLAEGSHIELSMRPCWEQDLFARIAWGVAQYLTGQCCSEGPIPGIETFTPGVKP